MPELITNKRSKNTGDIKPPPLWAWHRKPTEYRDVVSNEIIDASYGVLYIKWSDVAKESERRGNGPVEHYKSNSLGLMKAYENLFSWVKANDVWLSNSSENLDSFVWENKDIDRKFSIKVAGVFKVYKDSWKNYHQIAIGGVKNLFESFKSRDEWLKIFCAPSVCTETYKHKLSVGSKYCTYPHNEYKSVYCCKQCGTFGPGVSWVEIAGPSGQGGYYCIACSGTCQHEGCFNRIRWSRSRNTSQRLFCKEHTTILSCSVCGAEDDCSRFILWDNMYLLCGMCTDGVCTKCNFFFFRDAPAGINNRTGLCRACSWKAPESAPKLQFSDPSWYPTNGMTIESLPSRPIRSISYELEMNGDPSAIGRTLFKYGFIPSALIQPYSTSPAIGDPWPAVFTRDSSVTGGELIIFRMNMSKKNDANSVLDILNVLDILRKDGKVQFSRNAGGHVHVDAAGMSMMDMRNLALLFNNVEDFIFRIAGADDPGGHRSLQGNNSGGYVFPKDKNLYSSAQAFWQGLGGAGRSALNISNYMRAWASCACQSQTAKISKWDADACTCRLHKNTVEWRVFNACGNPRIFRAWIAFVMALTALAQTNPNIPSENIAVWSRKPLLKSDKSHVVESLQWVLQNLELTPDELNDLKYTVAMCEIGISGILSKKDIDEIFENTKYFNKGENPINLTSSSKAFRVSLATSEPPPIFITNMEGLPRVDDKTLGRIFSRDIEILNIVTPVRINPTPLVQQQEADFYLRVEQDPAGPDGNVYPRMDPQLYVQEFPDRLQRAREDVLARQMQDNLQEIARRQAEQLRQERPARTAFRIRPDF